MLQSEQSDISLRELVLKTRRYLKYFLSKWKYITLCAFVLGISLSLINLKAIKVYRASLSFMLNVDERAISTSVSSILGQFGIGVSQSESNLDKILDLSKTLIITQKALLDSTELFEKKDLLGNFLIADLELQDRWGQRAFLGFGKDSLNLNDYRFDTNSVESFSLLDKKALKALHHKLMGTDKTQGMFDAAYDEVTGIMEFHMTSSSEDLSIEVVNRIFEKLSKYYIDKSTEKQKYEYEILKEKYDSIYRVLNSVQLKLAVFEDTNKEVYRKRDILEKNRLKVEEQKLQFMISKAEEQLQLAKIALDNKTPYIQIIDTPLKPIKPENKSMLFYFVLGLLIGALLSIFYFTIIKMYTELVSYE